MSQIEETQECGADKLPSDNPAAVMEGEECGRAGRFVVLMEILRGGLWPLFKECVKTYGIQEDLERGA